MRVCIVNDNYYRSSGVAIAIRRIAENLPAVQFRFAGSDSEGLLEDLSWMPEGTYGRFGLKTFNPLRLAAELIRFRTWFWRERCDLVHCHHRRLAVLLRMTGLPVLYTGHLAFPRELWFRLLAPPWLTAVTPSVADNIFDGTGKRVIACISNPLEFPAHPPDVDIAKVRKRAVCIGRLDPVKGQNYLLKAWEILHRRGFEYHLDLVGEGKHKSLLEEQVHAAGIAHLVHFRGFVENGHSVINESLFAVLLSQVEGQGIVTLEAASMGRPSLLTAVPGSIDLLPPKRRLVNGLRFGEPVEAAEALISWFQAPEEVAKEGEIFFDYLKGSCEPATVALQYSRVYEKLLNKRPEAKGSDGQS